MPTEAVDPGPPVAVRLTPAPDAYSTRLQRAWLATLLAMVAFLAAIDRNILAVLLVPIQKDLGVGDTAMGALTGGAFSLVYATSALPLAWFADRTNRRNFIAGAVAVWSAMTAVCGLANNYLQLLVARFGVAAGEAAHSPAGMSLIADVFPATKRGAALSVLTIGSALGFSAGAYIAGVLNDRFGWQGAMMAVGLPGVLVALLLWLTVPEPARGAHDGEAAARLPTSVTGGLKRLATLRTFVPLMSGMIFLNVAFLGWLNWAPAFLMRVHHLSATNMSAVFGLVAGIGGVASNIFSGVISDRLARRGIRWRMYYCVGMCLVAAPFLALSLVAGSVPLTVGLMLAYTLSAGGLTTVSIASALSITPANLRATMVAVIGFAVAVFGGALAPLAVGVLNDALKGPFGDMAVRYTLMTAPVGLLLAGLMFFLSSRTIEADAAAAAGGTP